MKKIDGKIFVSREECERGALGFPVSWASFEVWLYPGNCSEFPKATTIDGVDHWEMEELTAFIQSKRG